MDVKKAVEPVEKALRLHGEFSDQEVHDIRFHLLDWFSELEGLVDLCSGRLSPEAGYEAIEAFLIHAPAHVAAAAKLFTGSPVTDVFEIGAVLADDDDEI